MKRIFNLGAGLGALGLVWVCQAEGILGSKHDLSIAGPGPIKAASESEVCLFCHTPHRGTGELPLWNHALSQAAYTPYQSSTLKAVVGQPTGASKLCLSCHDGTVALGMVASRSEAIEMRGGISTMPSGRSNLGTDLSDDHPISFTYNQALAAANGQLKDPLTLTHKVRLDHEGQVQCTACHDPHDNKYGKFMVQENRASALCLNCHNLNYWQDTSHRLSPKTWNGAGENPWPHGSFTTVADNACANCHATHGAGTKERLLNFTEEEKNCYSCHGGTVAAQDLRPEFNKFSAHPMLATRGVHSPAENPVNGPRHSACVDCHNPHASRPTPAVAPAASGKLAGVQGVASSGALMNSVQFEYELCYRCHADSVSRGPARVNRQFVQTNTRFEFKPGNLSYHPVEGQGRNANVPSLVAPWTTSSYVYCTDCHNNDQGPNAGGAGPNGPHGSRFSPILERQLILTDPNPEDPGAYALCYKCHSRDSILSNDSFKYHRLHVVDHQAACSTCHDAHGVEQNAKLINFNRDYVTPLNGNLRFNSTGLYSGNCTLSCHGVPHDAKAYAP